MKTTLSLLLLISTFAETFGQSSSMEPVAFFLPKVAIYPACSVAEKGKMVYNTIQNKVGFCNGTFWIEAGTPAMITPAFSVSDMAGQSLTTSSVLMHFATEEYDLSNSFGNTNSFSTPENGIYEFNLNADIDYSVPPNFGISTTYEAILTIRIKKSSGSTNTFIDHKFLLESEFPGKYINLSRALKLTSGDLISVYINIDSSPSTGSFSLKKINFTGQLVARY